MTKILILEANPDKDLSLDKEIRQLRSVLDGSSKRIKFQVRDDAAVRKEAIRKDQLQDLMLKFEAEDPKDDRIIVHFCGHGTGEQGLVFENEKGKKDLVSTKTLTDLFELFENRVDCVVLNACYSEVQAEAIREHIKYVIGMKKEITDRAAIAFSIGFYRALAFGRSFEDAFKFGTNAIQLTIDDSSKSRDAIAKEIERKLIPVGEVSETIITQEHLKPVLLKKNESESESTNERKYNFRMLTDTQRIKLRKDIETVLTEDRLKSILLEHEKKFGRNFYNQIPGNDYRTRVVNLIRELKNRQIINDFIKIVSNDYPNFAQYL